MTNAELVEAEIERFIRSKDAEVLCISGAWGVGKTYTWQTILDRVRVKNELGRHNYSYVSLFGANSLEDLKLFVFENTKDLRPESQNVGISASVERGRSRLFDWSRQNFRRLGDLPYVGSFAKLTTAISFSLVDNMMLCIDDLERRGEKLSVKDVLGLASFLKEQRNSKVVLLLNLGELDEVGRAEFEKHNEKVVDVSLTFSPTPEDSARIALGVEEEIAGLLGESCISLGIANIRVIKKIERHIRIVQPLIQGLPKGVTERTIRTLTLFGWSKYLPTVAPPVEYLLKRRGMASLVNRSEKNDDAAKWGAFLDSRGYLTPNEFDLALWNGLLNGYFNPEEVKKTATSFSGELEAFEQSGSFEDAWRVYHDSFEDNEPEVVDQIFRSFKDSVQNISPMNFNGTVKILRELGHEDKAKEVISIYLDGRKEGWRFWDLKEQAFGDQITEPDVIRAFAEKYKSLLPTVDVVDALIRLSRGRTVEDYEMTRLMELTKDEFVELFKKHSGEQLSRVVGGALFFARVSNATSAQQEMTKRARAALQKIGAESPLNARRVAKYGVDVTGEP